MSFYAFISIGIGAAFGAWLRWWFGMWLNPIFPTLPLGTLTANLLGAFLMGVTMQMITQHLMVSPEIRLAVTTGFLGGLTTFSTFSAETVTLLLRAEYLWTSILVLGHMLGSFGMTILGMFSIKMISSFLTGTSGQ